MNVPKVDTKFAKAGFMNLPPWAKGVIAVGVLVGIYFIFKKVTGAPAKIKEGQGNRQEDKEVNKEFDKLVTSGKGPTLSMAQMSQYANQCYTAMDGCGTDEEGITTILKKAKNDADVMGIIKAYGTKEVHPCTGTGWFTSNYKGNLGGAMSDEMSRYWLDVINADYKKKGIKHRF